MNGVGFICFLVILPVLAALGHDAYYYINPPPDTIANEFQFSDLGWLFVTYWPKGYDWAVHNIDPRLWKDYAMPILTQTAYIVAAVPAACVYGSLLVLRIFSFWPFQDSTPLIGRPKIQNKSDFAFSNDAKKSKKAKYKRK